MNEYIFISVCQGLSRHALCCHLVLDGLAWCQPTQSSWVSSEQSQAALDGSLRCEFAPHCVHLRGPSATQSDFPLQCLSVSGKTSSSSTFSTFLYFSVFQYNSPTTNVTLSDLSPLHPSCSVKQLCEAGIFFLPNLRDRMILRTAFSNLFHLPPSPILCAEEQQTCFTLYTWKFSPFLDKTCSFYGGHAIICTSDILALKQESRIIRYCRDVLKVSSVFLFDL